MIYTKCHVKKDDKVRVIAGKDKGKVGKVLRTNGKKGWVVIENVNLMKKHTKPSAQNRQGGIVETEAPIHSSNVTLMCGKCMETVRPRSKILDDNQKVRFCRKCGEVI